MFVCFSVSYWDKPQPDNGNDQPEYGEEDCGQFVDQWNDLSCGTKLQWLCESTAQASNISMAL